MGYTTTFEGFIEITPPLDAQEVSYLKKFEETRRMERKKGPFFVESGGFAGQAHEEDIVDYNRPPDGQPGLWCQWTVSNDGTRLSWNGIEKFYAADEWMSYIQEYFMRGEPPAAALLSPEHAGVLKGGHSLSGVIYAFGEDWEDVWRLRVSDDGVFRSEATNLNEIAGLVEEPDYDEDSSAWEAWDNKRESFSERLFEKDVLSKISWGEERSALCVNEAEMKEAHAVRESLVLEKEAGRAVKEKRRPGV